MSIRRLLSSAILIVIVVTAVGLPDTSHVQAFKTIASADVKFSCTGFFTIDGGWYEADRDNTGAGMEEYSITVVDGAGTILNKVHNVVPIGFAGMLLMPGLPEPYSTAPAYNPIRLVFNSHAGNGFESQVAEVARGSCTGLPYMSVPGCDVMVDIPAQAVGGQFVTNAAVYWAPDANAATNIVIEVGKTYLVAGLDATGMYYKVLINCTWVWVEVGTVGPNYDAVWNGKPLPGTIVK